MIETCRQYSLRDDLREVQEQKGRWSAGGWQFLPGPSGEAHQAANRIDARSRRDSEASVTGLDGTRPDRLRPAVPIHRERRGLAWLMRIRARWLIGTNS